MPKAEALPCNINTLMRAKAVIIIARLTHVCLSNGCLNKMYAAIAVQIGIQPFKNGSMCSGSIEKRV